MEFGSRLETVCDGWCLAVNCIDVPSSFHNHLLTVNNLIQSVMFKDLIYSAIKNCFVTGLSAT